MIFCMVKRVHVDLIKRPMKVWKWFLTDHFLIELVSRKPYVRYDLAGVKKTKMKILIIKKAYILCTTVVGDVNLER